MDDIDLHVHTNASDGAFTPASLVTEAKKIGLKALGVVDHDTVAGIEEAISMGKKLGVEIVPGCEFSVKKDTSEVHILGYYIDCGSKKLIGILEEIKKKRQKYAELVVGRLVELRFTISLAEVKNLAGGVIGKQHVAQAVINNLKNKKRLKKEFGKVPTPTTFIGEYLVEGRSAYVDKDIFCPEEGIALIEELKGVSVLAHPGYSLPKEREYWLEDFVNAGLDGMEVYHYKEDDEKTKSEIERLKKLTRKYNLIETGGSDFHGPNIGAGVPLGFTGLFLKVPYGLLKDLKNYRKRKYPWEKSL